MELTHTFTVPVDRDTAWAAFQDIGAVAECFPGASVTSTEGDTFKGGVKVKLGPIALQYSGSGEFVERDSSAYRMVIKAQGKDRRGNGTAGADVLASFAEAGGGSTRVEVVTELHITGRPAQFGRGVIQDVSDKLLGQFVDCLEAKVAPAPSPPLSPVVDAAPEAVRADSETAIAGSSPSAVTGADTPAPPLTVPDNVTVPEELTLPESPVTGAAAQRVVEPPPAPGSASGDDKPPGPRSAAGSDDALDLGATLLPVLLKSYGKQLAGAGALLAILVWLVRRRR